MKHKVPLKVLNVMQKVQTAGHEIFIVGGAVRDILMGKPAYDWDFTTDATPDEIQKIFGEESFYMGFGTVGVPSEDESLKPFEITTYRKEFGYSDKRRPDKVEWGDSLEDDLQRRDFTINAMALEKKSSKSDAGDDKKNSSRDTDQQSQVSMSFNLIDPYSGQEDLKSKLVRAVGNAQDRFSEDALRMMRAIRIASQLSFDIEEQTFLAIRNNAGLIKKIANERIGDELLKILASPEPHHGMELFRDSGLMRIILPELHDTFGVEQKSPGRHHIYGVGKHSMRSLKHVAEINTDPIVRLATLIHDIGKPQTFRQLENGTITFYNHEVVGARIARRIADRLRFSKEQKNKLNKLVRWHQFSVSEKQTDSAIRRFIRRVGIENVPDMLDLRTGDRLGGGASETSWRTEEFKKRLIEVQKQPFTVHDLKISGDDVMEAMGIKPGPEVGEILKRLYNEVVDKQIPNNEESLTERLEQLKENAG